MSWILKFLFILMVVIFFKFLHLIEFSELLSLKKNIFKVLNLQDSRSREALAQDGGQTSRGQYFPREKNLNALI